MKFLSLFFVFSGFVLTQAAIWSSRSLVSDKFWMSAVSCGVVSASLWWHKTFEGTF